MKVILCLAICVVGIFAAEENIPGLSVPGGPIAITEQEKIIELEKKIRGHFNELANRKQNSKLELLEIKSVNHRTAAGSIYELVGLVRENDVTVECAIRLWEQPWKQFSKLNVECGEQKRPYEWVVGSESETEFTAVGGLQDVSNAELPELTNKLRRALVKLSTEQGTTLQLRRVIRAQKQVIAGVRYVITAELASGAEVNTCTAEILETLPNSVQTNISCGDKKYTV